MTDVWQWKPGQPKVENMQEVEENRGEYDAADVVASL